MLTGLYYFRHRSRLSHPTALKELRDGIKPKWWKITMFNFWFVTLRVLVTLVCVCGVFYLHR